MKKLDVTNKFKLYREYTFLILIQALNSLYEANITLTPNLTEVADTHSHTFTIIAHFHL